MRNDSLIHYDSIQNDSFININGTIHSRQPDSKDIKPASNHRAFYTVSYWIFYFFALISISRNFSGGFAFVKRIIPGRIPIVEFPLGFLVGILASYAPYLQIKNSIEKFEKFFFSPGIIRKLITGILGGAAGVAFAEMGASAFSGMLTDDFGLGEENYVTYIVNSVFIMTLFAQGIMYTEKISSLIEPAIAHSQLSPKAILNNIWNLIKKNWCKLLPLCLNAGGSILAVATNQKFGVQASEKYFNISNFWANFLGVLSSIGPGSMAFVDTTLMGVKLIHSCSSEPAEEKNQPINQLVVTTTQTNFSFSKISFKTIAWLSFMACIAAIPNTEYSISVNVNGISAWSMLLVSIGVLYNVVPKFISSVETKWKESQELNRNYSFCFSNPFDEYSDDDSPEDKLLNGNGT